MDVAKEILAGGVAGVTSTIAVHPLDTIRTRLQTGFATSTTDAVMRTWRSEGALAFYKGMSFPLAAQFVYKSVIFGTSKVAEKGVRLIGGNPEGPLSVTQLVVSGAVGGGVNATIVTPVELVRNRLMVQVGTGMYSGPMDCIRKVLAAEGAQGLWRGLSSTLVRDMPGVGAWYATFALATRGMQARAERAAAARGEDATKVSLPVWQRLLAGALSGVGFWTVALPADAIKSVVQTDATGELKGSVVLGLRKLMQEGGVARLYRGYLVSCLRGIPGSAITFTAYSFTRQALG